MILSVSRSTLKRWCRKLGIEKWASSKPYRSESSQLNLVNPVKEVESLAGVVGLYLARHPHLNLYPYSCCYGTGESSQQKQLPQVITEILLLVRTENNPLDIR